MSKSDASIKCEFDKNQKRVFCILPITLPTSKIRLKRNINEPIAPRNTEITDKDYIEWQISYRDPNGKLIEFGESLDKALNNDMNLKMKINQVVEEYGNVDTFDKKFTIKRIENKEHYNEFKLISELTPILRLDNLTDNYYIDIILKQKQKAVGYQAMVFLYIPCKRVLSLNNQPLIGRKAYQNEKVKVFLNNDHILGLLKSFLVASNTHRKDILYILGSLNINV
ncbi:MAG: R.Pab1 family restriction endonuclease [Thermosulfidibacteraceae bacterium]